MINDVGDNIEKKSDNMDDNEEYLYVDNKDISIVIEEEMEEV